MAQLKNNDIPQEELETLMFGQEATPDPNELDFFVEVSPDGSIRFVAKS